MVEKVMVFWLWVHARLGCRYLSKGHLLKDSKLAMEDVVNGSFSPCPLWFGLAYWVLLTLLLLSGISCVL
jgi:hypothetical protein